MDKVELFGNIAHNIAESVGWHLDHICRFYEDIPSHVANRASKNLKELEDIVTSNSLDSEKTKALLEGIAIEGMAGYHYLAGGNNYVSKTANAMTDLYARKNRDYGNSFDKSMDKFGMVVSAIRIGDKVNRLQSLVAKKGQAEVKDESIADTFMDLACYAIMTYMWMVGTGEDVESEVEE